MERSRDSLGRVAACFGVEHMPSLIPGGRRLFAVALILPLLLAAGFIGEAQQAKPVRKPWTTSRVVGSPEPPPPFKVVRAFPNLKFHHPLLMARATGSDRLYVGEQAGVLYSFADRPDAKAELF